MNHYMIREAQVKTTVIKTIYKYCIPCHPFSCHIRLLQESSSVLATMLILPQVETVPLKLIATIPQYEHSHYFFLQLLNNGKTNLGNHHTVFLRFFLCRNTFSCPPKIFRTLTYYLLLLKLIILAFKQLLNGYFIFDLTKILNTIDFMSYYNIQK